MPKPDFEKHRFVPEGGDDSTRIRPSGPQFVPVDQIPGRDLPPDVLAQLNEYREAKKRVAKDNGTEADKKIVAEYEQDERIMEEYRKAA